MSWYTLSDRYNDGWTSYSKRRSDTSRSDSTSQSEPKTFTGKLLEKRKLENKKLKEELAKKRLEFEREQQQIIEDRKRAYEDMFIDDPFIHQINLAYITTTAGYKSGNRYDAVKGSFNAAAVDFNKNNNAVSFDSLKEKGLKYSQEKGQKLARDIANNSVGFTGYCSRHASNSLANTNLGNERAASAYMMAGKLANNKNFQEISPDSVDLKNLPAGCVLVYDRGAAGYNSQHGHIEITLGDGTACSDGRTYNVRSTQNMRIFVPIENA